LLCLAGCQSVDVTSFEDPRFVDTPVQTYSWEPEGNLTQGVVRDNRVPLQQALRKALTQQLHDRGWTLVDPESADVWVRFMVGAKNQSEVVSPASRNIPGQYRLVRTGAVAVDLIDPGSGIIRWRGVAQGTRKNVPKSSELQAIASRAVHQILREMP